MAAAGDFGRPAEVDWLLCAGLNRLKDLLSKDITDTKDKIHVRSPPQRKKLTSMGVEKF